MAGAAAGREGTGLEMVGIGLGVSITLSID